MPADNRATFEISAASQGLIEAAAAGKEGLNELRGAIDDNVKAIGRLQSAQQQLKRAGGADSAGFEALTSQLQARKQDNARLIEAFVGLGGDIGAPVQRISDKPAQALTDIAKKAQSAGNIVDLHVGKRIPHAFQAANTNAGALRLGAVQMLDAVSKVGGPFGGLVARAKELGVNLGTGGSEGASGLSLGLGLAFVGFTALTGAVIAATAAFAKYSIGIAEVEEKSRIQLRSLGAVDKGLAFTADQGRDLENVMHDVRKQTAASSDDLKELSTELFTNGLKPKDYGAALRATAQIASTQGLTYAKEFAKKVAIQSKAGLKITPQIADVDKRLGNLAAEAFGTFTAQATRLKDSIKDIFGQVDLTKITGSIAQITKTLVGHGSQAKSFTQVFIDGVAYMIDTVHLFVLNVENAWLRVSIASKKGSLELTKAVSNVFIDIAEGLGQIVAKSLLWLGQQAVKAFVFLFEPIATWVDKWSSRFGLGTVKSSAIDIKGVDLQKQIESMSTLRPTLPAAQKAAQEPNAPFLVSTTLDPSTVAALASDAKQAQAIASLKAAVVRQTPANDVIIQPAQPPAARQQPTAPAAQPREPQLVRVAVDAQQPAAQAREPQPAAQAREPQLVRVAVDAQPRAQQPQLVRVAVEAQQPAATQQPRLEKRAVDSQNAVANFGGLELETRLSPADLKALKQPASATEQKSPEMRNVINLPAQSPPKANINTVTERETSNTTTRLANLNVTTNIYGNATRDDADAVGRATGKSVADELRNANVAWGVR